MNRRNRLSVVCVNDIAFIVDSLGAELSRNGIDFRLIGRKPSDPSARRKGFLETALRINRSLRNQPDYDILHINYGLFGFFAFDTERPVVLHLHGSDVRRAASPKGRIVNLVSRVSMMRASSVWYSTTDLAPYFEGLDTPHRFMPSPVALPFFEVGLEPPESPHILFAVPLNRLKGAKRAIEAMQLLAEEPGIHISAFAYDTKTPESVALRARIPKSVTQLPWTPHADMPALLGSASIVVGSMGVGTLGVTELEAMAAGRPLIVNRKEVSPFPSDSMDGAPVIYSDSASDVRQSVAKILTDGAYARRLGQSSRAWALEHHSPRVVARLYAHEYRTLVEER